MEGEAAKVLEILEAQCSNREYCTSDVRDKAAKKLAERALKNGMTPDRARISEQAEEIVESLVDNKFVDDLRYSSAFAREKASLTGWGPFKIRMALGAKGIAKETADKALEEIDSCKAGQKLDKLVQARHKALKDDPQVRLKLLKYALGRGYGYDEAERVVNSVLKAGQDGTSDS